MDLRKLRQSKGLKQDKVAKDTGIDIYQISRIENGALPTLEDMITLEFYFDSPIDWPVDSTGDDLVNDLFTLLQRYPKTAVLNFAARSLRGDIKNHKKMGSSINANKRMSDKVWQNSILLPPEVRNQKTE